VPPVPLSWNIAGLFTEGSLQYGHASVYRNQIDFLFVTVAFFMPSRIGFPLWFLNLAGDGYGAVREVYFPPRQEHSSALWAKVA